jgi:anti-anti-sigma factor
MNVKTDTKEKFHVITIQQDDLSANMTELEGFLLAFLQNSVKNVILNCKDIHSMDNAAAGALVKIQQKFYENDASFVICALQPALEEWLDKEELLELLNCTPTESEAWDIIQMEEIERELMDEEDPNLDVK